MIEENRRRTDSTSGEPRVQIPKYAWPITGVFVILIMGAIVYFSMGKYEHKSLGQFVGPVKCRECHQEQYDSWKKTRMANSFKVLLAGEKSQEKKMAGLDPDKDYTHDETCLPCHTTGYGLVGGFVSVEQTPEMAGVSCEACHGHGGTYVNTVMNAIGRTFQTSVARKVGLVYPPTENVCRECHNARSPFVGMDYKFHFNDRVKLGTHEHYHLKYAHGK